MVVFENTYIKIKTEPSEIPWLIIYSQKSYKEFTECDKETEKQILSAVKIIEKALLEFYQPDKINIASFGNYLPHVHFHVMARFKQDSFFPEPMWGKKQRDGNIKIKPITEFLEILIPKLTLKFP